jgi:hypothetical protein
MADKQLAVTAAASAFQKEWFAQLRQRVFERREPYALVQADVPFELFDLLDVPAVSNQWWAAVIAAKQQAPGLLDAMAGRRPSRRPVPLLQSRLCVDALWRRGIGAVGRVAAAAAAVCPAHLRLHPSGVFHVGGRVRRRLRGNRSCRRRRAPARVVDPGAAAMA